MLAMVAAVAVAIPAIAKTCEKCHGSGFVKDFCTCRYCNGSSAVAPGRLGKYSSVTRWTVTSSYIGGAKIGEWESDRETKYYSNLPCPAIQDGSMPEEFAGVVADEDAGAVAEDRAVREVAAGEGGDDGDDFDHAVILDQRSRFGVAAPCPGI